MAEYVNMAMCDLRHITLEAAKEIREITNVALVIFPKTGSPELMAALARIEQTNVASTMYLDDGEEVQVVNGIRQLNDADFAPDGSTIMLVNGVCVAGNLSKETKGKIHLNGMVIFSKALEGGCGIRFPMLNGMVNYLEYSDVKICGGEVELDADMLSYLEPGTLLLSGEMVRVAPDVTGEMLKEKRIIIFAGTKILCDKKNIGYIKATASAGVGIWLSDDECTEGI
jgi:hypothetical protein